MLRPKQALMHRPKQANSLLRTLFAHWWSTEVRAGSGGAQQSRGVLWAMVGPTPALLLVAVRCSDSARGKDVHKTDRHLLVSTKLTHLLTKSRPVCDSSATAQAGSDRSKPTELQILAELEAAKSDTGARWHLCPFEDERHISLIQFLSAPD